MQIILKRTRPYPSALDDGIVQPNRRRFGEQMKGDRTQGKVPGTSADMSPVNGFAACSF